MLNPNAFPFNSYMYRDCIDMFDVQSGHSVYIVNSVLRTLFPEDF